MSELRLYRGTPHPLTFAGEREKIEDMGPLPHPPRSEVRGIDTPVNHAMIELGGLDVPVPLYEVAFGPVDVESARAIGSLAVDEFVVVSRLAERGAVLQGVSRGFVHPAIMERDETRRIVQAHAVAAPVPTQSVGRASEVFTRYAAPSARWVINCLPEDMHLRFAGTHIAIPRAEGQPWIDAEYSYSYVGESAEGVTVATSKIQEVRNVPNAVPGGTLLLSHTEAIIEAIRTGVSPEVTSRMVFAVGLDRGPEGFQGSSCAGLGYYSQRTLQQYLDQVGF